jgi:hypothetical protein
LSSCLSTAARHQTVVSGVTFFLPAGYRPTKTNGLIVLRDSGLALVVIDQDGRVFQNLGAATGSIAFDGLSFRTDEG